MKKDVLINILAKYKIADFNFVDVGAKGELEYISDLENITNLYAFEPNPAEFNKLREKYSRFNFKKLSVNDLALGSTVGQESLNIMANSSMSSLLLPDVQNYAKHFGQYTEFEKWKSAIATVEKIKVKIDTIDNQFAKITGPIDYLKLDTQGSELDILKGAEQLLKKRSIKIIKVEVSTVPVYKQQAVFSDIDVYLKQFGYVLVDFKTYRNGNEMRLHEHCAPCGDAFYVVEEEGTPENKIKIGVMLLWLGYASLANNFFNSNMLEAQDVYILNKFGNESLGRRIKRLLKLFIPPILHLVRKTI